MVQQQHQIWKLIITKQVELEQARVTKAKAAYYQVEFGFTFTNGPIQS